MAPGYPRACGDRLSGALRNKRHSRVIPAPAGIGCFVATTRADASGYPRACGDRLGRHAGQLGAGGLSPRLRGSGAWRQATHYYLAGYPRACGDRNALIIRNSAHHGLSPRLRGSADFSVDEQFVARVIPAPAGIGGLCRGWVVRATGYPRACGDRELIEWLIVAAIGLSPRLRGSAGGRSQPAHVLRVIPAPAGIGRPGRGLADSQTGYPRACGDRRNDSTVTPE